ncbi:MAG TPA: glycosyltransferase family 2 protein [Nocardioidaceae bacterium]|nr:glycosyltransferase family 2 protein [Nocardioidaceae bacterium]
MPVDVSVVIATYNTGPKLEPLLASLASQSLPADRYEVLVVDDGSTDDTWERLQAATERMGNLRIERIPNSGWPGRPRNVGTDLAQGRYVFYSDHDDEFFPEALARMVAYADETDADLLIGKEIRAGALGVGQEMFLADRPRADLFEDHVLSLMTPHRLFRTSFLREQGIRFPEGKRRLEDHVLLAEVYTRTDRIAVLGSYPCYRWIIYPDQSNNSAELGDPRLFFDSLADVFDVLDAAEISDQRRDDLYRFWYASRMLKRLSWRWFSRWDEAYRDDVIEVIRDLAARRVPDRVDADLEPVYRRRAALLRAGNVEGLVDQALADHQVHLRVDSCSVGWTGAGLRIDVSGTLADRNDEAVPFAGEDADLKGAQVDLFLRQRPSGVEWYAAGSATFVPTRQGETTVLTATTSYVVDPATFVFGEPLDPGVWAVFLHARALGYDNRRALHDAAAGAADVDGLTVVSAVDREQRSVLRVSRSVPSPRPGLLRRVVRRARMGA